jgi:hypothetical protein
LNDVVSTIAGTHATCSKEKVVFETNQRLERNHVVPTQEMHKMKNNTQNEKKNLEQFFVNR